VGLRHQARLGPEQGIAFQPHQSDAEEDPMLFDFSEPERNTARRALEIYVSDLREEIVKTEKHEWRQALHKEKEILERVIEQLSI
jgi:ribosomal protein S2